MMPNEQSPPELLPSGSILKQALDTGPVVTSSAVRDGVTITVLDRGVILFEPANGDPQARPLKSLLVSAGVHGNETAPIELVDTLVNDIVSGHQTVAVRLLVILGNPEAMIQQSRFVEENLNRIFNGIHRQRSSLEADRAAAIEAHVEGFFEGGNSRGGATGGPGNGDGIEGGGGRVHYDLHTAIRASAHERFAVVPFEMELSDSQLAFLTASEIQAILLSNAPTGTFSYYTKHRFGAESFTVELGKVRPFGQNDPARLTAIDTQLRCQIAGTFVVEGLPQAIGDVPIYSVVHEVMRRCNEGFQLHIDDDVANFTELPVGHVLTTCRNRRAGETDRRVSNDSSRDGPDRRQALDRRSSSDSETEAGGGSPQSFREFVVTEPGSAIVFPIRGVPVGQRVALIVKRQEGNGNDR